MIKIFQAPQIWTLIQTIKKTARGLWDNTEPPKVALNVDNWDHMCTCVGEDPKNSLGKIRQHGLLTWLYFLINPIKPLKSNRGWWLGQGQKVSGKITIRTWTRVLPGELTLLPEQGRWKSCSRVYSKWPTAQACWKCRSEWSWCLLNHLSLWCIWRWCLGSALCGQVSHWEAWNQVCLQECQAWRGQKKCPPASLCHGVWSDLPFHHEEDPVSNIFCGHPKCVHSKCFPSSFLQTC